MSDEYVYRSERAPPLVAYAGHVTLPAENVELFSVTIQGDDDQERVGALEICFSSTVSGTLRLKRTITVSGSPVTTYETLNLGSTVTANIGTGPEIKTFASGETIAVVYSATGGTYYLTVADVSGDTVKMIRG